MEMIYKVVERLREKENFNGYIHVKSISGADRGIVDKVGHFVDRMSVNIELPTEEGLKLLAPQKNKENIFKPMEQIKNSIVSSVEERKNFDLVPNLYLQGKLHN